MLCICERCFLLSIVIRYESSFFSPFQCQSGCLLLGESILSNILFLFAAFSFDELL